MPPKFYRATCLKEIYWRGETHRAGDPIKILYDDVQALTEAGVVGDVRRIDETEYAVASAPENAARRTPSRRQGR